MTLLWSPRMRQFNIFYYEHKHVKSGVTQPAINGRCWVSMNEAKRQPDIPTHIHAGQENLMAEIKSCKFTISPIGQNMDTNFEIQFLKTSIKYSLNSNYYEL